MNKLELFECNMAGQCFNSTCPHFKPHKEFFILVDGGRLSICERWKCTTLPSQQRARCVPTKELIEVETSSPPIYFIKKKA
jgi:hypothetical protein